VAKQATRPSYVVIEIMLNPISVPAAVATGCRLRATQKGAQSSLLGHPDGGGAAYQVLGETAPSLLLNTGPTSSWLHNLWLTVQVAREELGLPVGAVVNRRHQR
jgi:hypothetical protein